ncbi:kinesin-domain-containing protein [Basidiobolus meristosporus CBS 931.73]|uniref:Kinesin-like protein n=1 Tax=Basidiobolus meristosporus CBS 931.73 TaxID=1314790 RepID=A0A1Y1YFZ7_9FUNG|nr:kinesin-domain-containing protein [Basidiobolus meristosporus CBS 931.73]|eukprot:ORX96919.1 kinesin-domain-containing protein [Basidiobolus meristosporus CBS 931.73]
MSAVILETLRQADLEHYYPSFAANGITTIEELSKVTMQDYGTLGVNSMDDRKRLFQLIQAVKNEHPGDFSSSLSRSTSAYSRQSIAPLRASQRPPVPPSSRAVDQARRTRRTTEQLDAGPQQRRMTRSMSIVQKLQESDSSVKESDPIPVVKRRTTMNSAYGVPPVSSNPNMRRQSTAPSRRKSTAPTTTGSLSDRIRVCIRKRPLSSRELKKGEVDIISVAGRRKLAVNEPKLRVDLTKYVEQHEFVFDEVFDSTADNEQVYTRTALPLVEYIFEGGKATCFAYGQTGSGKTFTMLDAEQGLYVLAGRDIFTLLDDEQFSHLSCYVSFYEIYQGQLHDLLNNRKKLAAREDGNKNVVIVGIREIEISCVDELLEVFNYGHSARTTGTTGANADSSRSHAILQMVLKHKSDRRKIHGKFSFIDLAGSERGADRGESDNKTRMEGAEINKSLLALKECIRALDQGGKHLPFRQSKLTQVLKDSFIGNSRTCMIGTISPNMSNSEHSLNTLRYADRVKELKGDTDYDDEDEDEETGYYGYSSSETDVVEEVDNNAEEEHGGDFEEVQESEPENLIHDEAPPEFFSEEDNIEETFALPTPPAREPRVSQEARYKPQYNSAELSRSRRSSVSSFEDSYLSSGSSQLEGLGDLIKSHKSTIREITYICQMETMLMQKLKLSASSASKSNSANIGAHAKELEALLDKKTAVIADFKEKLRNTLYY